MQQAPTENNRRRRTWRGRWDRGCIALYLVLGLLGAVQGVYQSLTSPAASVGAKILGAAFDLVASLASWAIVVFGLWLFGLLLFWLARWVWGVTAHRQVQGSIDSANGLGEENSQRPPPQGLALEGTTSRKGSGAPLKVLGVGLVVLGGFLGGMLVQAASQSGATTARAPQAAIAHQSRGDVAAPVAEPPAAIDDSAAREHYEAAEDYIGRGELELALIELDQAVAAGGLPDLPPVWHQSPGGSEAEQRRFEVQAHLAATAAARPLEWREVAEFTGTGAGVTPPFTIRWRDSRVRWSYSGSRSPNTATPFQTPSFAPAGTARAPAFEASLRQRDAGYAYQRIYARTAESGILRSPPLGQWYLEVELAYGPWRFTVEELR